MKKKTKWIIAIMSAVIACLAVALILVFTLKGKGDENNDKATPKQCKIESAIGFELDETGSTPRLYCEVPYTMEYMDLSNKITVTINCTWKLYQDLTGANELVLKSMNLEIGLNTAYITVFSPNGDLKNYQVNVYRLDMKSYTFKNLGGVLESGTVQEKSTVETRNVPDRTGYTFTGWAVEGSSDIVQFPYLITEDTTFIAQYETISYTITYYLDGGENDIANPESYDIETPDIILQPATRIGYSFDGWYEDEQFSTPKTTIALGSHGNIRLYAKWGYSTEGLTFTRVGDEYTVTGYTGTSKIVVIPQEIDGVPITTINKGIFQGCELESLTIPFVGATKDGAENTHFGYIFGANSYENSPYVPQSLKTVVVTGGTIGYSAFYYCTSLTSVIIDESITSIGEVAFSECTSLTSIVIPEKVTSIGQYAFSECTSLTNIVIPEKVTSIGQYAFRQCNSLTIYAEAESKPNSWDSSWNNDRPVVWSYGGEHGVTESGMQWGLRKDGTVVAAGFSGSNSALEIPEIINGHNVIAIVDKAFRGCVGIKSATIGNSITTIGESAFMWCTSLESIEIPNSVTTTGMGVFENCTGLKSVIISEGMTRISNYTFENCTGLKSVIIPNTVTRIGYWSFHKCTSLETVYYKGTAENWQKIDDFSSGITSATCYYYSATEPPLNTDRTNYDGNYWHYDTDGKTPVIWKKVG